MEYVIKKSMTGRKRVVYDCPSCNTSLRSLFDNAGQSDYCPSCRATFIVPGYSELKNERAELERRKNPQPAGAEENEGLGVGNTATSKLPKTQSKGSWFDVIVNPVSYTHLTLPTIYSV